MNKIGVSFEYLESLTAMLDRVKDPHAKWVLNEVIEAIFEVDIGDCE